MNSKEIIKFMGLAEKLKCEIRHSTTSTLRPESVAEHSWRLCLLSWLLSSSLKADYDMNKVLKMCMVHDLGEAISGDIPSFNKSEEDEKTEEDSVSQILDMLDGELREELDGLFAEMKELNTPEAKLFKALDKMEAVIQHNEAPIETWIPLEYELNMTYGTEEVKGVKVLEELREEVKAITIEKISNKAKA